MSRNDLTYNLKINVGHCDLYFVGQWFCLISRSLFDVWTSYFGIMSQYDRTFDLKTNISHCISWSSDFTLYFENYLMYEHHTLGSWVSMTLYLPQNICSTVWPIFHGQVILPNILKTIQWLNIILWEYESVWHDIWPQNKCRPLWSIFHGPVILHYILKTIWYMNTILRDHESVWPDVCLKIFVAHYDLYFMVKWFCLISWKLFSGWTSYFGIMSWYDPTYDLQIFVGRCDLYFRVHCICPLSWRLYDVWTSYFRIISEHDTILDLEINVGHFDLYFMVQWFCLIS